MHDDHGSYNLSYGMLGIILVAITLLVKIVGATTKWSGAPPGIDLDGIFQPMFDSKQGRLHSRSLATSIKYLNEIFISHIRNGESNVSIQEFG